MTYEPEYQNIDRLRRHEEFIADNFAHIVLRKYSRFGCSWKGNFWVDQWYRVQVGAPFVNVRGSK